MPINDYEGVHFTIPRMPNFLSPEVKLVLTEESKRAFAEAGPKQGFIGLVELPDPDDPNDDPKIAKIHLLPAFNKNDGLARVNKEGKPFSTKVIESQMELGSMTGDLHTYSVSALGLGLKGGAKGLIMGFGVWKSGCGVRIMDSLPSANARIANEYILVKNKEGDPWTLYFSDENCEALEIEIRPELASILARLPDKAPENLSWEDRQELERYLRTQTRYGRREKEGELGFAKNRSSSQNAFVCQYLTSFRTYFDTALHDRKSAHSLSLPRELPFSVFEKVLTGVSEGLKIPTLQDLINNPKIPTGWIGPRLHFSWERAWSRYPPEKRLTETYAWALLHKRDDILEYLFNRGDHIDFNRPLSLAGKPQPTMIKLHNNEALPLHIAIVTSTPLSIEFLLNQGADPLKEHSGFNSITLLEFLLRSKPEKAMDPDFQKITALLLKKILQQPLPKFEDIKFSTLLLKLAFISQDKEIIKALVRQLPFSTFLATINQLAETNKELLSLELLDTLLPLFSEDERFALAKGLHIGPQEEFLPLFFPAITNLAEKFLQALEEERLNPESLEEIKELTKVEQKAFWNFLIAQSSKTPETRDTLMSHLPNGIYRSLMLETAAAKDPHFYKNLRSLVENLRLIPLEERPIELMKEALSHHSYWASQELLALLPTEEQIKFLVELIADEAYPVCHRKKIEGILLSVPKELRLSVLITPSQHYKRSALEEIFPGREQIPASELLSEYQSLLKEMKDILNALPEQDKITALSTKNASGFTPFHYVNFSFFFLYPLLETLPKEDRLSLLITKNAKEATILHSLIEEKLISTFRMTPDDFMVEETATDDEDSDSNDIWQALGGAKDTRSLEEKKADMEEQKKEYQEEIALLTQVISLIPPEDRVAVLSEKNKHGKTILHSLLSLTQKAPQAFPPIETALEIIQLIPIEERHALLAEGGGRKSILLCSGIDNYLRMLSSLPPKDIVEELTTPKPPNGRTMLEQVPQTYKEKADEILAKAKEELAASALEKPEPKASCLRSFSLFKEQRLKPAAGEEPEVRPEGPS